MAVSAATPSPCSDGSDSALATAIENSIEERAKEADDSSDDDEGMWSGFESSDDDA